jgi:hypothetical protein
VTLGPALWGRSCRMWAGEVWEPQETSRFDGVPVRQAFQPSVDYGDGRGGPGTPATPSWCPTAPSLSLARVLLPDTGHQWTVAEPGLAGRGQRMAA